MHSKHAVCRGFKKKNDTVVGGQKIWGDQGGKF